MRATRTLGKPLFSRSILEFPTASYSSFHMMQEPFFVGTNRFYSQRTDKQGNIIPIYKKTVTNPIKFLPQQYTVLQERFGKCIGTKTYKESKESFTPKIHHAGLNVFAPLIDDLVYVINTENVYAVTHQHCTTSDNASIKANGVFYYKITDPYQAAYGCSDFLRALAINVENNLRDTIGTMKLKDVIAGRDAINKNLQKAVGPAAKNWGVEITRVEINEIKFHPKLEEAMDHQLIAERERNATETAAEAKKRTTVLNAEAEQTRLQNEATGKKEATIREAEGKLEVAKKEAEIRKTLADADAYSKVELAKAEATAIEKVSEAMQKNPDIAKYFIAQGTVEAYKKLASSPNHKTLLFPTGQSSMVTALSMASELLGESTVKKAP